MRLTLSIAAMLLLSGCMEGSERYTKERSGQVVCINGVKATITNETVALNCKGDSQVRLLLESGVATWEDTSLTKVCNE